MITDIVGTSGLPALLTELLSAVNLDAIEYSGRANDVELLNDALSQGDHSMAETWAKRMITRQQQYRHAQKHGLPSHLQALIDQVNAEEIGYSGRANDVELLNDALSQGDHSMAETWAKRMIERQRNIHARKTNTTQSN